MDLDWAAAEADVVSASKSVPGMGDDFEAGYGCPSTVGKVKCLKRPHPGDPVHVSAIPGYGVCALWHDDGPVVQVHIGLYRRFGRGGLEFLFADEIPHAVQLTPPRRLL